MIITRKTDDVIGMQFVDEATFDVQSKRIEQAKMNGERSRTLCANRKDTLSQKVATAEADSYEAINEVEKMDLVFQKMEKMLKFKSGSTILLQPGYDGV